MDEDIEAPEGHLSLQSSQLEMCTGDCVMPSGLVTLSLSWPHLSPLFQEEASCLDAAWPLQRGFLSGRLSSCQAGSFAWTCWVCAPGSFSFGVRIYVPPRISTFIPTGNA